jgi:hypothetical protein
MVVIACSTCRLGIRVLGEENEVSFLVGPRSDRWPNFTCVRCGEKAEGILERALSAAAMQVLEIVDLSPQEAFAAVEGMGLPAEQQCGLSMVRELLKETPVRRVHGHDVPGTQRCAVDSLELWDGTKIYLGASPEGAVVYRISPPHSYVAANG